MKMYFKPILLSGLNPENPNDPLHPPVGSQIGPTGGNDDPEPVNIAPATESTEVFSPEMVPFELPIEEPAERAIAPAAEDIAPAIEIAPIEPIELG